MDVVVVEAMARIAAQGIGLREASVAVIVERGGGVDLPGVLVRVRLDELVDVGKRSSAGGGNHRLGRNLGLWEDREGADPFA